MKSTNHIGRHLRTLFAITILGALAPLAAAKAQFQKAYDDNFSYSLNDEEVRPTLDGGHIQTGFVYYWSGASQVVLHKTDANGVRQWTRVLHSSDPSLYTEDKGYSVTQVTSFGRSVGYLVVGTTKEASSTNNDILVVRTNASGTVLWRKAFIGGSDDIAYDVQAIPSDLVSDASDFIITGSTDGGTNVFLMRLDPTGNLLWFKRYARTPGSGYQTNVGYAVTYLPQSNQFAVTGYSNPDGAYLSQVPFVMKTQSNGTLIWGKTYSTPRNGTSSERYGVGKGIIEDGNGGDLIMTGWMNSFASTNHDALVARIDPSNGVPRWFKSYDSKSVSTSSYNDFGFNIRRTGSSGEFVMAGTTDYVNDAPHVFMVRLRSNGSLASSPRKYLLRSVIDPRASFQALESSVSMDLVSTGFVASANAHTNGMYLIRTNGLLSSLGCEETIEMRVDSLTPPRDTLRFISNGCDTMNLQYGDSDFDVTTDSCTEVKKRAIGASTELAGVTLSSDVVKTGEQLRIGNLPSSGTYTIQVLDVVGRAVATETREVSETGGDIMIPTDGWRSGLYLVRITHGDAATSHRISVVR